MGFEEVTKENLVKWAASENLVRNSRDERRRKKETKKGGGPLDDRWMLRQLKTIR